MKTGVKKLSYVLVAVLLLSVAIGGPQLGPFGVDVVSAATGQATPTTKPAPSAPASSAPKAPVSYETATEITRFLAFGSYGGDVKLLQEALNKYGYQLKADGIFGRKTEEAVKDYQSKNGLRVDGVVGPKTIAKLNIEEVATTPQPADGKVFVKLGKVEYAAHGTKCFTVAAVAMAGDKVVDAVLDDYQVMSNEGYVGVPNSDADFGANLEEGKVLVSKRANAAAYSENMAKKAGATVPVDKSLDAIQDYVTGKTVEELEKTLAATPADKMVDAVSGATLVDTHGYVSAIVEAAKSAKETTQVDADAADSIKLGKVEYAAHGTKCFTISITAMLENEIVGALLDDYQVMSNEGYVGVPNSDADFGANFGEEKVLVSKRANAAAYSENMAKKAGATVPVDKSLDAIQDYVTGKTVEELEKTLAATPADKMVDAVSGATLVDTHGYVSAIVEAAKSAMPVEADAVSGASVVTDEESLLKAMSKDGTWIVVFTNDFTTDKELVLEGEFTNKDKLDRKIALYTQDENRNVLDTFTLTAPKLTIKSPSTRIQNGTFKGDLYVSAPNVQLRGAKIEGDVFFTTQEAKDTFEMDDKSSIMGKQILSDVDAVSTASIVRDDEALQKAMSKDGSWIICTLNDITTDKELVLEGEFRNKNLPENDLKRKIGLYTHNVPTDKSIVTHRFTLTAPSLTIRSPYATLQHGIFVGDIYVEANNFSLVDQAIIGNIYFANEEAQATFVMDEASSVTGVQIIKVK